MSVVALPLKWMGVSSGMPGPATLPPNRTVTSYSPISSPRTMNSRSAMPGSAPSPGRMSPKLWMPSAGSMWVRPSGNSSVATTSDSVKIPDAFIMSNRQRKNSLRLRMRPSIISTPGTGGMPSPPPPGCAMFSSNTMIWMGLGGGLPPLSIP